MVDAPVIPVTPSAPVTPPAELPPAQSTDKSVVLHPLDDPQSVLAKRSVFFEYDSYEIAPEGRALIETHSKYLNSHASARVPKPAVAMGPAVEPKASTSPATPPRLQPRT